MSSPAASKARPLSPHLQIYKPQLTTALSIFHRITGVGLSFGMIIFVAWLVALAGGAETYTNFLGWMHTLVGQIILFGLSAAFFYHFCCGIRHLLWDAGYNLEIQDVYKTGRYAVIASVLFTVLFWLRVYGVL